MHFDAASSTAFLPAGRRFGSGVSKGENPLTTGRPFLSRAPFAATSTQDSPQVISFFLQERKKKNAHTSSCEQVEKSDTAREISAFATKATKRTDEAEKAFDH